MSNVNSREYHASVFHTGATKPIVASCCLTWPKTQGIMFHGELALAFSPFQFIENASVSSSSRSGRQLTYARSCFVSFAANRSIS